MVLHQEEAGIENLGAHAFTEDPTCVSGWQLSSPRPSHAYGPEFAWQNGSVTKFASRERPQVVLNEGGWPTHLSNGVITSGWSGLSFTVVAPINTSAARHPSEMDAPHAPTVGTAAGSQGDTERHREAQRETEMIYLYMLRVICMWRLYALWTYYIYILHGAGRRRLFNKGNRELARRARPCRGGHDGRTRQGVRRQECTAIECPHQEMSERCG